MKCPQCGRGASGQFCSGCGSPLKAKPCGSCGAELAPGARFCTQCGNAVGPSPRKASGTGARSGGDGNSQIAWWVAGSMAVFAIVVVLLLVVGTDAPPAGPAAAAPASNGMLDLASMSPREAADRLFNRVMTAASAGNTAEVAQFMPMAIQSYDMARPLDQDGLFHLALLNAQAGDFPAALAAAQEGLAENPDHLLNLSVAGDAAAMIPDDALARQYYQHFLDVYEDETIKPFPEYQAHGSMFPEMKLNAEAYLGG